MLAFSNPYICDAQTDQETTIFALSIRRNAINEGVKLLLETAFRPVFDEKTVAEAVQNVDNDIRYLKYEKIRDKVTYILYIINRDGCL